MAKLRTKSDRPQVHQLNLFDYVQKLAAEKRKVTEGSLNVKERLRASLNAAIKQCNLSRHQIAGEMSHLVGADITRTQIDSWTAESKDLNRIPAEYLPAFCRATGSIEPMRIIAEAAGAFAMPGPDAIRSEIQKLREQSRKINAELRKREIFVSQMEADQ
jgi:hypothetical protein